MPNDQPLQTCEVCGARVVELRRRRCWGCYSKWAESRPVGLGAACTICGDRRRDRLKMVELLRAWVPVCHNCFARASTLSPMPQSLEEVRRRLQRERRRGDRRHGKPDTRVFPRERRGLERRTVGLARGDDLLILDDDDIIIVEDALVTEDEPGEETVIRRAPTSQGA